MSDNLTDLKSGKLVKCNEVINFSAIFELHDVTGSSLGAMRGCPLRVFLVISEFLFFLAIAASFRRSSKSRNFAAFSAFEKFKISIYDIPRPGNIEVV